MEKEVLRLFKGYLGEKSENFSKEGLKYGILIPDTASDKIVKEAIEQYGKDGEKWNQTFHKDFEIVKNAPIEDLIAQQLIHYITTYGFESLGFYDSNLVYLPKEKLEIPELVVDSIELIPIKPITEEELTDKLMILLTSGIALSEQTIEDIMALSDYIDKDRFDEISNREIKITLYDKYNIMPKNPDEFFRYLIFKTTGDTLKINNSQLINKIKNSNKEKALTMLESYMTKNGLAKLSSIFLRNKDLFLAFKVKKEDNLQLSANMNRIINALRKFAVNNHRPLPKNILDCLTDENVDVDLEKLPELLDNITIFREIRIINGILYRLYGSNAIVYKIRNGKSYVKTLDNRTEEYVERLNSIYEVIHSHLISRLKEKVNLKTIYIPSNVTYAAPTSEKQFNGNIPEGSYLEIPRDGDMVYGIHWTNLKCENNNKEEYSYYYGELIKNNEIRVDLDLKQMNKSEIFGWDASYRSKTNDIQFSGDITDAPLPNGATELFHIGQDYGHGAFLVTLNNYTQNNSDIPFEFVIAKGQNSDIRHNYVLNPNNILEKINMVVKSKEFQMTVGFITIGDTIRFYFNDFSQGFQRTSKQDDVTMNTFDYLQSYSKIQLKLADILKEAGAILTDKDTITKEVIKEKVDDDGNIIESTIEKKEIPVDINLSLNSITKETLIDMLS